MAGDHGADELNIKGWQKYYNTTTITGRRNIAVSTYAMMGLAFVYFKFIRKPKPVPLPNKQLVDTSPVTEIKKHH